MRLVDVQTDIEWWNVHSHWPRAPAKRTGGRARARHSCFLVGGGLSFNVVLHGNYVRSSCLLIFHFVI